MDNNTRKTFAVGWEKTNDKGRYISAKVNKTDKENYRLVLVDADGNQFEIDSFFVNFNNREKTNAKSPDVRFTINTAQG